jgi:gliding motility-associated-like protein
MKDLKYLVAIAVSGGVLLLACVKQGTEEPQPIVYTLPDSCNHSIGLAEPGNNMYFPNAFTPNGDGRNDVFRAISVSRSVGNYRLSVARLNGQVLFETTDLGIAWGGRDSAGNISQDFLFRVNVQGITPQTQGIDECTFVYLLPPGPNNCARLLTADANMLRFEDQFDPQTGGTPYTTAESLCP